MNKNSTKRTTTSKKPIDIYIAKQYEDNDEVNIPNREINFSVDVEDYTIDTLLAHINKFQEMDAKKPVTILFNSPGGEVTACFKYYDLIRRYPFKVNSFITGVAMSAATVMSIGTTGKRTISKNSAMMIHEVSSWPMGTLSKLKTRVKFSEQLQDRIIDIYIAHTKLKSKAEWEKIMATETYYTPAEALKLGLVDEIV